MKRIACIGAGYWGQNLVRNFAALDELQTICDQDGNTRRELAERYPDVNVTGSVEEVLTDTKVAAVAIATSAVTHYEVAKQAILAGKDVFVEKPLAVSLGEARELVELARSAGRVLMVGHLLQYHPGVVKLKELVDAGELGKIHYVYSNRLNIGKLRRDENILWSFAPHDISVMLMILGESPQTVRASGGSYLQRGVADVTVTTMDFVSGVQGHIFVSWLHPYKEQRFIVVGDRKMAVFDDVATVKLRLYAHRVEWIERVPTAQKAEPEAVIVDDIEPLAAECHHFIECVETRAEPRTSGREGLRVLEVLQACQESLDGNGRIVAVRQRRGMRRARTAAFVAHPTAVIEEGAEIGEGTKIWHFAHIMPGARIGRKCIIGQNVVISNNVAIGDNVKIQNNVSVYEGVTLEDSVFCGPSMVFTNVINPRSEISRRSEFKQTVIRKGASLGANSTIVCGHAIGRFAFVGAGAVVTRDVPDYALVVGNPARLVGWMCRCGNKLSIDGAIGRCLICGNRYSVEGPSRCSPIWESPGNEG